MRGFGPEGRRTSNSAASPRRRASQNLRNFSTAIEHHKEHLAIAKEVGDRAGEGRAYANLGIAYHSQGDFSKAIEYHGLDLAIAKEVGDRAGEGMAYGNLGIAYQSQGEIGRASCRERVYARV